MESEVRVFLFHIDVQFIALIQVLREHPELNHFQGSWPIHSLMVQYLKNSSEQAHASDRRRSIRLGVEPRIPTKKRVKKGI